MGWRSVWQAPYRPLFFLAGLWALVVPMAWLLPEGTGPDSVAWHRYELVFGMAGAAGGGYLLTALPAWTKRGPVSPAVTVVAACLWCAARLTSALSSDLPFPAVAIGASTYFAWLTAILAHGVLSSAAWHRFWAPLGTAALGVNASLFLAKVPSTASMPLPYVVLIILIGGRAAPAFTRRWLAGTRPGDAVRDRPALSCLAIAGVLCSRFLDVAAWQHVASGLVLVLSAALLVLQMCGWHSFRTRHYPALFILHLAFAWTPAGLALSGLATLFPDLIPPTAALHALTMGAMGAMMAALMMRSAMVRSCERLVLTPTMAWAFALVSLAALLRVCANWTGGTNFDPIGAAAACWMTAWALFLAAYWPALRGPVPRPVFSAAIGNRTAPRPEAGRHQEGR
nr:NnrS family protein [Ensifer sp. BR816]